MLWATDIMVAMPGFASAWPPNPSKDGCRGRLPGNPAMATQPVDCAQAAYHVSDDSSCICRFTSEMTVCNASSGPAIETICSAPGPEPTASPMEIFAPLVSLICLMAVPPFPMIPPTAARGTRARSFSSPSAPQASDAPVVLTSSLSLSMICFETSFSSSSELACAVRTRQSVLGKTCPLSVNASFALQLLRIWAMTAPPLPMMAEASASPARYFMTCVMDTLVVPGVLRGPADPFPSPFADEPILLPFPDIVPKSSRVLFLAERGGRYWLQ
mmetsp:Transcript_46976/g.87836  ORF Transcript_46976/g.87836 Transcript_46976/m.87836 type:complete len:272 (-) Transcript_46976:134-949(-)